jgi:hypothetical protein
MHDECSINYCEIKIVSAKYLYIGTKMVMSSFMGFAIYSVHILIIVRTMCDTSFKEVCLTGMPTTMDGASLHERLVSAEGMVAIQRSSAPRGTDHREDGLDPAGQSGNISPQDLQVLKEKFPQLAEFSNSFLRSRTMDELLRIESTSLRIKDAERARESEDRLAANKVALQTKFYDVPAGRDNRWNELRPARFLPGCAATAIKQYTTSREVIGLVGPPPPLGCYDMSSVGMGGFVTSKGWLELGTQGTSKLKVEYFNLNNAAKSSTSKVTEGEDREMKDVSEFELALRTLRSAAQFACLWNYSYLALENFLYSKQFCKAELQNDPNPARTLCQFSNFVVGENSSHWRDGTGFLTPNELAGYWSAFIGARPQAKVVDGDTGHLVLLPGWIHSSPTGHLG